MKRCFFAIFPLVPCRLSAAAPHRLHSVLFHFLIAMRLDVLLKNRTYGEERRARSSRMNGHKVGILNINAATECSLTLNSLTTTKVRRQRVHLKIFS